MYNMGAHPDDCSEIALDVRDDSVEGPNVILLDDGLEKRTPSLIGNVSARVIQVSEELIKHLPSFSRRYQVGPLDTKKKSTASHALEGFRFVSKNNSLLKWDDVEKQFNKLSKNGLLNRSDFGECIGLIRKKTELINSGRVQYDDNSRYFSERLFDSLRRRSKIMSDSIDIPQLKVFWEFWNNIADQSFDARLQTFFDMVDKDGDGRITEDEVREIIRLSASDNKLSNIQKKVDAYAALIMEELKEDNHDYITIESLEKLMFHEPTNNVTGKDQKFSHLLSQNLTTTHQGSNSITKGLKNFKYFLHGNWKRCWVFVLWIGIMAGLFTWKYIEYKHRDVYHVLGPCVCIAKGAAETLKLNMAIVLLPVCRNTVTWLRNKTKLGAVVPFDDNINFHQVIAVAIAFGVGLHAISHLACDFPRLIHATEEEYKPMQQYFGDQAQNYWHFLKEVEGYTGIIMIVLMTIAFTLAWLRKGVKLPSFLNKLTSFNPFKNSKLFGATGTKLKEFITFLNNLTGFNVFWYSHHLLVIVYALLIVHGIKLYLTKEWYKKTTWMYIAVPVLLYTGERLIRSFRSRLNQALLRKVVFYPGNVVALHMTKPQGFKYQSGQYIFVKYADISQFEWHPFSITSAPGDDYLSVHIRKLGDWTEEINKTFRKRYLPKEESEPYTHDFKDDENIPEIRIDGPYGAPAVNYKEYDVVLLVGLGIGATPMISIVKNILNNLKAKEEAGENYASGANTFRTTRAYFYWVTPEQGSFDWFKGVMNEVAEMNKNGVIEMHCYCTSVYQEGDARSGFIAMLQKVGYDKKGVDVVTDTRVMSHFGRPDWPNVYKRIANTHKDSKIGVFYCGNSNGIPQQKKLCFSHKTSAGHFMFHKENF